MVSIATEERKLGWCGDTKKSIRDDRRECSFYKTENTILRTKTEKLSKTILVKADNHIVTNEDNRYTHLTALVDHFLTLFKISSNIMLAVGYVVLLEELLGHLAEVTGWGCINCYGLFHRF